MSAASPAKRMKGKWHQFKKSNQKARIEIGVRGFLATCNFREKDCRRETLNILTTYADQLYVTTDEKEDTPSKAPIDEMEDDISTELQNEIDAINSSNKKKSNRFQNVETDIANLVFVKTTLPNPVQLGAHIVGDIASTRKSISRFLLRFIPVEVVCKATIDDIRTAAGKLFDIHFLNCPPKTYSIVVNKRYNNSIQRDEVIEELAGLVAYKNVHHKVDLKNADFSVIVEILKGICCLSVLPNYLKWKKYNISELVLANPEKTVPVVPKDSGTEATKVSSESKNECVEAEKIVPVVPKHSGTEATNVSSESKNECGEAAKEEK